MSLLDIFVDDGLLLSVFLCLVFDGIGIVRVFSSLMEPPARNVYFFGFLFLFFFFFPPARFLASLAGLAPSW